MPESWCNSMRKDAERCQVLSSGKILKPCADCGCTPEDCVIERARLAAKTPREILTDEVVAAIVNFERATGVRVTWLEAANYTKEEDGRLRFDPKNGTRTVALRRVSPVALPNEE